MGLLDTVKDEVVKIISQKLAEYLLPEIELPEDFDIESLPERTKAKFNSIKEEREKQVTNMATQMKEQIGENFSKLNTNITLLVNSTTAFVTRIAMIPARIISVTPVGPGVAANEIPAVLADLKADGEVLGKAYDDTKTSLSDLLMGLSADQIGGAAGVLAGTVSAALGASAILLALVGIGKDGVEPSVPEITPPIDTPEYKASECTEYEPDDEHSGINPETQTAWEEETQYCKNFIPMLPEKSVSDFSDIPGGQTAQEQYDAWLADWIATERAKSPCGFTCNDCKKFKK